ncbi:MAG: hypothetical protein GTO02_01745 [Candidatus Dadabacteria bacterium]|nr:hypothetical protein [Candidatus Dadabacteria bacterium]
MPNINANEKKYPSYINCYICDVKGKMIVYLVAENQFISVCDECHTEIIKTGFLCLDDINKLRDDKVNLNEVA